MTDPQAPSVPAKDTRLELVLGEVEAAAQDTTLLAFTMALEAARSGPVGHNAALVAQAMCNLSIRANAFSTQVRRGFGGASKGGAAVADLQKIGSSVTEILNQAAQLAADDLDGSAVDETAQKDSSRLLEQIHAHIRDLDALLGTRAEGRVQTVKALTGTHVQRGRAARVAKDHRAAKVD
jgi:methyl-accepting chemotaxis protein